MDKQQHPLRQYRKQNNLTQKDLAIRLNVSGPVVHSLECNPCHPTVRRVLKYCRDYRIDPSVFFPDEE